MTKPRSKSPPKTHAPTPEVDAREWPAEKIDSKIHAAVAQLTGGLSPSALYEAYADWAIHLAAAPGTQMHLANKAARKFQRLALYVMNYAMTGRVPNEDRPAAVGGEFLDHLGQGIIRFAGSYRSRHHVADAQPRAIRFIFGAATRL